MIDLPQANDSRQFLFRKEDLDQPKSETAGKAILSMNPDIRVKSYTSLVSKETEGTFSDDFFKQQVRFLCHNLMPTRHSLSTLLIM